MKKLGICVCYQHSNYGSQLQSYATTVELKNRNIDFEIIRYKKKLTPKMIIKLVPRLFNPVFINDLIFERYQKKLMLALRPQLKTENNIRNACLAKFSDERFKNVSPFFFGYDELCRGSKRYSAVMVGSDQLWAPGGITSNFYNLMFADDETVKISYATSLGVSRIKDKLCPVYKEFLSKMDFISVRENSGKELVEKISGKECEVVVDPVLLLTADEWLEEIPNKHICNEPYIFAYFLGKSSEYRTAVTEFAKKKKLKIVTSHHMDSYNKADEAFGDYAPFDIGPEEFVNLIRNAEYVFTDSFHGSVFSALYKKQFLVFNRYSDASVTSKNSRIDSFCENYGLCDRRFNGNIDIADNEIDYTAVQEKIDRHKARSKAFLDRALSAFN